jgi:hypothetical protein
MLAFLKLVADFSRGCAGRRIGHLLFATHPHLPHNLRIDFFESQEGQTEQIVCPLPRSLDQVCEALGHELVNVVVEAVVYAVDVVR